MFKYIKTMETQNSRVVNKTSNIYPPPKLVRSYNRPAYYWDDDRWSMENMELYKNTRINTKELLSNLFDNLCNEFIIKEAKIYPEPLEKM